MSENSIGLILLTGMPGSGKEEFVKACLGRGIRVLRMGDFVRAEAKARGLDPTDENVGGLAQKMREEEGFDYWAKKTAEALDDRLTLVDGLRGRAEYLLFHKRAKCGIAIVAIHSSPNVRYQRLVARARSDAPKSPDEFEQRDVRELRWGLGDVIARADYMIVNETSLEDLKAQVEAVLNDIVEGNKACVFVN
ncbi:MAG TPA: AAA family ATPase [Thermoplasmata archaeon]|nr:AAA family ATPase [Thermoplasmata archaeon]